MHAVIYALIQVVHNFGAAAVIGLTFFSLLQRPAEAAAQRRIFIAIGIAWAVQGASGAAFGIATWSFYGKLPDIHGVALAALGIKVTCVVSGLALIILLLRRYAQHRSVVPLVSSAVLFTLGVTALSGAAFLRWFS